ncbi:MAG TPA: M24 family metallopeptidase [Polyangiales bacterium]
MTPDEIARFRDVQQLAYRCTQAVERELRVGMTERVVARLMRRWLADHGVTEYFHVPFCWFGDRTSFTGAWNPLKFAPTARRLEPGMPVILDVAPSLDGYCADIGYGCCLGENAIWAKLQDDLAAHRTLIVDLVRQRRTAREIYLAVDALAARQGYENRHSVYPGRVLAHRVFRLPRTPLRKLVVGGFGAAALHGLGSAAHAARARGQAEKWPLWNDRASSDVPVTAGLWAVEPHLGAGPVGSKWEEILVVTESDAYWLDDELPHVRRWAERGVLHSGQAYGSG